MAHLGTHILVEWAGRQLGEDGLFERNVWEVAGGGREEATECEEQ